MNLKCDWKERGEEKIYSPFLYDFIWNENFTKFYVIPLEIDKKYYQMTDLEE